MVERGTRYCDRHKREGRARHDAERGTAAERGYDATWRRVRAAYLSQHPLCVMCAEAGRTTAATVVDHIATIAERPDLRLDPTNLRSLCKPCHDSRTGRDQAWGRATKCRSPRPGAV